LIAADEKGRIQAYLVRNAGLNSTASADDRIVCAILAGHDGRRGYIYHLAIHRDFRKKGIARKLVQRSIAALVEAGIQKCHIFIFNDNSDGIAF